MNKLLEELEYFENKLKKLSKVYFDGLSVEDQLEYDEDKYLCEVMIPVLESIKMDLEKGEK